MERLNENEVKLVAEMQRRIDEYENFIQGLFLTSKGKEALLMKTADNPLSSLMTALWVWVKEKATA